MTNKIYYVCPVHSDIVLYEEPEDASHSLRLVTIEPPEECSQCKKSYYKWECEKKQQSNHDKKSTT